jgi:hypothetical protein
MAPRVKEAVNWLSDALETAAGWAIVAVALYGILFVDISGNGRLWDAVRGVAQDTTQSAPVTKGGVQMRVVPVRPPDLAVKAQNHMLLVPEADEQELHVAVQAPAAAPEQLTDSPADTRAGRDWRVGLKGKLRTFTVYGRGEERSSASASVGSAPAASAQPASASYRPTPAVAESAYRQGAVAEARPGISSRVTPVATSAADGVRNFR